MSEITEGAWVRVHLDPACPGGGRPHNPQEDGPRAQVTALGGSGDHTVCVLVKGGKFVPLGNHLPVGRHYRLDELEPIPEPP
jgi:hypothetical protein